MEGQASQPVGVHTLPTLFNNHNQNNNNHQNNQINHSSKSNIQSL